MTVTAEEGDTSSPDSLGLWMPIAELAKSRNLARQVMYRKVEKLARDGRIEVRIGVGGVKLVSLAAYDRAVAESGDLGRTLGSATRKAVVEGPVDAAPSSAGVVYTREQARHMAYRADMAQLDLDERRGQLMRKDRVLSSAREGGAMVVQTLEGFIHLADDLTAAANREGTHGVRRILKKAIHDMRQRIADTFADMASAAEPTDPASSELPFANSPSSDELRADILNQGAGDHSAD